ncbi:MAG: hypothetical protein NC935_05390 [Candidatus Omnitrophica bacterium]|nr:hypothetical protein [Candidatus Omnitrophota bacterium]
MANPLPNEEEIYEIIKKEKIEVHPLVWDLIDHHIRNDLNAIAVAWGSFKLNPGWFLRLVDFFIKILYRVSFQPGEPDDLFKLIDVSLERVKSIDRFLRKLKKATYIS